ncbi:zinc-binding dehydrogenase [Dactylosporangium sp. CA-233914]|uniref:zinc-binding dehydrogenase n=1 Tax=Dactylosporangium sp. CA-233914 TaxID=3239934 RepID=UPI003D8D0154
MRRMICTQFGDPELLQFVEEPTPEAGPGEVLIETEAAGVSFVDGLIVRGAYQVKPPLPFTPGNCLVGVVVAVGAGVDTALMGQRVATVLDGIGGAYSSHVVVAAYAVAVVPDGIATELAAASMESYLTLTFGTTHRVSITPGEQVVVLGAGGGIGLAAVDIARGLGASVTAVASTEEKRAVALKAGASAAIGYDNLKDQIRQATGGGADVVIDPVGGAAAESALRALATGGRYCVVGFASGKIPRLPTNVVLLRNRSVVGIDWGDWSREVGGVVGNVRLLEDVFARIAVGDLHPPTPSVAPLVDAGQVLKLIAARRAVGKYVLKP